MTGIDYLVIAGTALAGWFLISRPMSRQEARASRRVKLVHEVISLGALAAMIWFAWWM